MPILSPIGKPGILLDILNYCNKDGIVGNANDMKGMSSGVNCSCYMMQAYKEMMDLKKYYNKCKREGSKDRDYHHYVLSFAKNEFSVKEPKDIHKALDYAVKLVNKVFGERCQVWMCVHINSGGADGQGGCLHVHIVINSVCIDGMKLQTKESDLEKMRLLNDEIAISYGFTPVDRTPEAVAERGRAQLYTRNQYKSRQNKDDNGILRLQAAVAICKALGNKPSNWDIFCNKLRCKGWDAQIRGRDISLRCLTKKYKSGKDIVFRASRVAKYYKHTDISPNAILKAINYPGYELFKKKYKPYKQQCSDDIMWVLQTKKPKEYKEFADEMEKRGWITQITKRKCIMFERIGVKRKNKSKISYSANRLAKDYNNLNLSSQLIMQQCGAKDYIDYVPRGVIGPDVCSVSQSISDIFRALQPNLEQSIPVRKNNMKVDLSGDNYTKKEDSSLSI